MRIEVVMLPELLHQRDLSRQTIADAAAIHRLDAIPAIGPQ